MQTTFDVEASIKLAQNEALMKMPSAPIPMHPPIDFVNLAEGYKTNEQKILEALVAIKTDIRSMLDLYISTPDQDRPKAAAPKMFSGKARR